MAGEYMSIREHYDRVGVYMGQTHGCSCCAHEEELDVGRLQEHIRSLEKAIEQAKDLIKIMKRKEEMDEELRKMSDPL